MKAPRHPIDQILGPPEDRPLMGPHEKAMRQDLEYWLDRDKYPQHGRLGLEALRHHVRLYTHQRLESVLDWEEFQEWYDQTYGAGQ